MSTSIRVRYRAALVASAALATALCTTISPASAATTAPTAPTELFNGLLHCSTDSAAPVYLDGADGVEVEGIPQETDTTDYPQVATQFLVWPTAAPAQAGSYTSPTVANLGNETTATIPASALTDAATYAWQARTVAGGTVSKWSKTCYFAIDDDAPGTPTVTSANYPSGQWDDGGSPVQLTLGAGGAADVAGYGFSWNGSLPIPFYAKLGPNSVPEPVYPTSDKSAFVAASAIGGTASLSLIPPNPGFNTLTVESYDRAYNVSKLTTYQIFINSTAPTISAAGTPQFDTPTAFTFTPDPTAQAASPIVSYSVTVANQSPRTVKAAADGTATVKLRLNQPGGNNDVTVTSTSANGWVSNSAFQSYYFDTTPVVASTDYPEGDTSGGAGISGTFTFTPQVSNVVSYTYSFDFGNTETTVAADKSGAAQISWAPPASGLYDLNVYATTKDGLTLQSTDYIFFVN